VQSCLWALPVSSFTMLCSSQNHVLRASRLFGGKDKKAERERKTPREREREEAEKEGWQGS